MAKASVKLGYQPPAPPREPTVITLHLSPEEAATLITIGRRVGGCPDTTPRKHINAINDALNAYDIHEKLIRQSESSVNLQLGADDGTGLIFRGGLTKDFTLLASHIRNRGLSA